MEAGGRGSERSMWDLGKQNKENDVKMVEMEETNKA